MFYPKDLKNINEASVLKEENLAIQLYGKRIYEGQTVGEYLLEFLLVFLGANGGKGGFNLNHDESQYVKYITNPNVGLKRFIFFENSKAENKHPIDREASQEINKLIIEQINSEKYSEPRILYQIKDLFYGFNLITKQRSWFAQAMMPLCEELVFCEVQNNNERKSKDYSYIIDNQINSKVDTDFAFTKHSFLGRGGEVYYMHLLQGLKEIKKSESVERAEELSLDIEKGIRNLLNAFPQFRKLSSHIQKTWEDHLALNIVGNESGKDRFSVRENHKREMECEWIKNNFVNTAKYSLNEMKNILKTSISELEKLELINIGIILQIFRFMISEAYYVSTVNRSVKPIWLIQVPSNDTVNDKVKKMSVKYYSLIENYMITALAKQLERKKEIHTTEVRQDKNDDIKELKAAYKNSHKLMRKIGKDIGLIIPVKGQNIRFTITDDLLKYFVLSMIEPDTSMTLDSFLAKLYEFYGIVIREDEYIKHYKESFNEETYAPFLSKNLEEFVIQLRNNGFLKELSDATAIVMNPYESEV